MPSWLTWWIPWEPSPTLVVVMAATAILYLRGCRARRTSWPRQVLFWSGFGILYFVLHTRLDYYSEHAFFVHRLQHLVLHHMGPFLIALSHPGAALRAGFPLAWRTRFVRPVLASAPMRAFLDFILNPVVASVVFVGLIYFWLWPPVHFDAMIDARLYRVMNWSMAVDGLFFWWLILDPRAKPPARLSAGLRVLLSLAVMIPQIVLGAYITFTHHDLYPIYVLCGHAFTGMSAASDQVLGGLILWIPTSMMSVLAALIAFHNWLRLDTRAHARFPLAPGERAP